MGATLSYSCAVNAQRKVEWCFDTIFILHVGSLNHTFSIHIYELYSVHTTNARNAELQPTINASAVDFDGLFTRISYLNCKTARWPIEIKRPN